MKRALRKTSTVLLVVALVLAPMPRLATADDSIAKINKVTELSKDPKKAKEVSYPTAEVQLVTDQSQTNVDRNTPVQAGQAVLTRSANTYVKMEQGLETLLYSNTFVRFDGLNIWLLRHGSAYVVSKRGKLEIVAEALGRILVNSRVYLSTDGNELLAYVTEGHVVLEANARTLSLRPGQAGRIRMGEAPEEASLTPEEQARIKQDIESAEHVMKGGGGGGLAIAAIVALAAGAAIAAGSGNGGGKGGDGGSGGGGTGSKGLPDLVPDTGKGGCRFEDNGNVILSVRNQGQGDAQPSTTHVELDAESLRSGRLAGAGGRDLPTPGIRAGGSTLVPLGARPAQGVRLRVTADASGRVAESNEENNIGIVTCPAQ